MHISISTLPRIHRTAATKIQPPPATGLRPSPLRPKFSTWISAVVGSFAWLCIYVGVLKQNGPLKTSQLGTCTQASPLVQKLMNKGYTAHTTFQAHQTDSGFRRAIHLFPTAHTSCPIIQSAEEFQWLADQRFVQPETTNRLQSQQSLCKPSLLSTKLCSDALKQGSSWQTQTPHQPTSTGKISRQPIRVTPGQKTFRITGSLTT